MYGIVKKEYHSGGERGRGEVLVILMALHFWKFTYVDHLITDWEGCVYVCVCVFKCMYICANVCIYAGKGLLHLSTDVLVMKD